MTAGQEDQDTKAQAKAPKKVALKVSAVRSVSAEDSAADKKSMGQVRKTVIFLGFVAVAYALYLVFTGQVDEFVSSLAGVDMSWIVAGVICFLFYYVFGILAYVLSVAADPDCPVGIRDLMSVEASGVFFMRLTPNSAGAPPAQIFRLTRAGMSAGAASALNFTRTIIYETGEGVFAAIMLVFCGSYFYETFGDVTLIGLFLFGFKVVQVAGFVALCLLPKPVMAIGNWALRFANRRKWLKDDKYEKYYDVVNTQVMEFSRAFKRAAANVPEMLATMGVTLLQLGCMYALPYFVLCSFGEPADFLVCLASGSMLELLVNAVPLPGGAGGAEVGFAYLFQDMYGVHLTAGFVIWRAIEYLLPVIIAAPCMGLRSTSGESINRRAKRVWKRVRGFVTGKGSGGKKRGAARGGVTVKPGAKKKAGAAGAGKRPAGASDVEARIAAGKAAAAAKKAAAEADEAPGPEKGK
ncbi:flippase-like domain-containing protein [Thermophilibacter sp. ET337]|uniref:lysylphosphatidylglycerol synthase transmembrane domain-containing protein n=1 Tax=Thermophilibacter sp. ET337 TaxID=2973084 RepID=UPI0021ABAA70|nr:lysylphosphatidylglycerol synthase transmembrane domain-containing protein [Thermophilibacter sp. ET337]MCR8907292.1 flippase-like domain-containing protein [Thermophilibacter sp. ET337]